MMVARLGGAYWPVPGPVPGPGPGPVSLIDGKIDFLFFEIVVIYGFFFFLILQFISILCGDKSPALVNYIFMNFSQNEQ